MACSAAVRRVVIGTRRVLPPLVVPTWPHQSERAMVSWPRLKSASVRSSAMISPRRSPASPASKTNASTLGSILLAPSTQPLEVVEVEELDLGLARLQLREPRSRLDDAPLNRAVER